LGRGDFTAPRSTPSPLGGEGWGEGAERGFSNFMLQCSRRLQATRGVESGGWNQNLDSTPRTQGSLPGPIGTGYPVLTLTGFARTCQSLSPAPPASLDFT
jgi:hypothetical protein